MKLTFYISWIVFIGLMILNKVVTSSPDWAPSIFKCAQFLSYFILGAVPMLHKYEGLNEPKGVSLIYLEALVVSFFLRSILFLFSFFKIDGVVMSNRMDVIAAMGGFLLLYYILEVRLKLKRLEDKYFKY